MEHNVLRQIKTSSPVQLHFHHNPPLQSKEQMSKRETGKPDAGLLASMVEDSILPFHQKSKNDMMSIYDLSQQVYYRHHHKNPELAKLAASLFLFFSDLGYYLNMEHHRLLPAVRDLIKKVSHSKPGNEVVDLHIQELKLKIQREHYSVIDKLKYFRVLTADYKVPEGDSKSYKLLFDKLKKLENDLVSYIHFEIDTFFPLVLETETYVKENKLISDGRN